VRHLARTPGRRERHATAVAGPTVIGTLAPRPPWCACIARRDRGFRRATNPRTQSEAGIRLRLATGQQERRGRRSIAAIPPNRQIDIQRKRFRWGSDCGGSGGLRRN